MSRNTGIFALAAVVSLCMAGVAHAASTAVNVDFNETGGHSGTYSGAGAASDPGTYWNGIDTGAAFAPGTSLTSSIVLLASNGVTTTPISVTITNFSRLDSNPDLGFTAAFAPALFDDFVYDNGAPTFSINNLIPGAPYDLYLYSMTALYPGTTAFIVGGVTTTVLSDPAVVGSAFNDATTDSVGNYVLYSHVTAVGGTISGTFSNYGADGARLNGFQLILVPEPASLGLLLAGGVMLLRRRRA